MDSNGFGTTDHDYVHGLLFLPLIPLTIMAKSKRTQQNAQSQLHF